MHPYERKSDVFLWQSLSRSLRASRVVFAAIALSAIAFMPGQSKAALREGVLCCLEFEEGGGTTAANATGNTTFDATLHGATWGTGHVGSGCTEYDGIDDYCSLSASLLSNRTNGSVLWWAKPSRNWNSGIAERMWGQSQASATGPDLSMLHFDSDNKIYVGWWNSGDDDRVSIAANSTNYGANTWHHYALTWVSGGDTKFYHNGTLVETKPGGTSPGSMAQAARLGHSPIAAAGFYHGAIDQWCVWNRALSIDEINIVYNGGSGLPYSQWDPGRSYHYQQEQSAVQRDEPVLCAALRRKPTFKP